MPTTKKPVTVYFDDTLYARVAAAAKADRRSVANFIEAACDVVAPHELGTRVVFASGVARPPLFEEFLRGTRDSRARGEVFIWASRGDDERRFDIPREVLNDCFGDFAQSKAVEFCEQHRKEIEAACRLAWSLAPASGQPIILTADHFQ